MAALPFLYGLKPINACHHHKHPQNLQTEMNVFSIEFADISHTQLIQFFSASQQFFSAFPAYVAPFLMVGVTPDGQSHLLAFFSFMSFLLSSRLLLLTGLRGSQISNVSSSCMLASFTFLFCSSKCRTWAILNHKGKQSSVQKNSKAQLTGH